MPEHVPDRLAAHPDRAASASLPSSDPSGVCRRPRRPSRGLALAAGATLLAGAVSPGLAWAATPRKDAGFQGVTSQKAGPLSLPVAVRVAKNGKSVSRVDIQWTSKCASPTGRGRIGGLSVTRKRKLSKTGAFSNATTSTQDLGNGTKAVFKVSLKGKFRSRTRATGTFKVSVSIRDAAGQQVDTCDTKTIKWTVRD